VNTTDQAVFVLRVLLAVGPLAVYFLGLGLVNSQARPCMINARADFTLLVIVFLPVILFPAFVLIEHGWPGVVGGVLAGVLALFFGLLPKREQSWVVYNCSPAQCRRLLGQAARELGWRMKADDEADNVHLHTVGLRLAFSSLPWLRSVTLRIDGKATPEAVAHQQRLLASLRTEMRREALLPSATGASLVLIGVGLLGLPMWYLFHHMNAIVEVVRRILSA